MRKTATLQRQTSLATSTPSSQHVATPASAPEFSLQGYYVLPTLHWLSLEAIKKQTHDKKEWDWVICRDVDGSRDCHTEWSKTEREKQISYINAYMWNLEKWYIWTGLQGRNWDTDVENKRMDTKGGKWGGWWWWDELGDLDLHIYTNMYKMDN